MEQVEVNAVIDAPIRDVWARYTDQLSWTEWAGVGEVSLAKEGSPPPSGVGCVRVVRAAGITVHEEVLALEAPHRMSYRVVRGAVPITDHHGEVQFSADGNATRVVWRVQFKPKLRGTGGVLRWVLTRAFRNVLAGLARDFQRRAAPPA